MAGQRQLQVTPDHATERLDHFLARNLPDLTRSQIKRLVDDGAVTLDGKQVKAGHKLRGHETVQVTVAEPAPVATAAQDIPLAILYEDAALIVVDKPAHMVVHPAPGHHEGTLVNALLHHCQDLSGVGGELRPGIVHRLDKATSGVMVATKDDQTHNCLARQFKAHSIQRRYREKMSGSTRAGRRAVTHWQVLRRYSQERLTLLDLKLETGRTHQIRVHLSEMNLPVVGDPLYGNARKARAIGDFEVRRMVEQLDRQFLHAWQLGFQHPDGRPMRFFSPLPAELQELIDHLEAKYGTDPADLQVPSQTDNQQPVSE